MIINLDSLGHDYEYYSAFKSGFNLFCKTCGASFWVSTTEWKTKEVHTETADHPIQQTCAEICLKNLT